MAKSKGVPLALSKANVLWSFVGRSDQEAAKETRPCDADWLFELEA